MPTLGLLLPNDCHLLDIWFKQICRMRQGDDRKDARVLLDYFLEVLCTCRHGGEFRTLLPHAQVPLGIIHTFFAFRESLFSSVSNMSR